MSKPKHPYIHAGFCVKVRHDNEAGMDLEKALSYLTNFSKRLKKELREREEYQKPSVKRRKRKNNQKRANYIENLRRKREERD